MALKILISNDDGVYAWGLNVLYQHLKKLGKVWVVAPLEEKSTTGHSLTIHKPLRLNRLENGFYGVSGSPADCVYLGIREVMKTMPDLVVSGINRGANMGQDIYYSGTVSAAREACILGIPAISVSSNIDPHKVRDEKSIHFDTAARAVVRLLKEVPIKSFPKHTLLNVNVPDVPARQIKGMAASRMGFRFYSGKVLKRVDHRGKPYYWVGGQYKGYYNQVGTDCQAVAERYISVTPVRLDCTDHAFLETLEQTI